jgi:uncharacterized protein (TIGR02453 family)
MGKVNIEKSSIKYLKDLSKNNNREWFHENKDRFTEANNNMKAFLAELEIQMNKIDEIDKTKLFRIYRDVRFSKDKTPYNIHFSMSMSRAGADKRGGYYLRITPGGSVVACGFFNPEPKDLKLIRNHIAADDKPLRKILKSKKFIDNFDQLEGEKLKTSPKGFDKDHPAIDLLRHKAFLTHKYYKDVNVTSDDFMKEVVKSWKAIRPFFDYMSNILTHDLNGVSLLKK